MQDRLVPVSIVTLIDSVLHGYLFIHDRLPIEFLEFWDVAIDVVWRCLANRRWSQNRLVELQQVRADNEGSGSGGIQLRMAYQPDDFRCYFCVLYSHFLRTAALPLAYD
ncbi:hypothetical protein KC19_5G096700 [Ceratodon purpureus]|uniref:Uncharacterized protein n=1 Tax=Ceratodon purpureus TaxID=3225 RepID=A0A8T0I0J2_CERPU|nr:hypothetical protein KC19_5G096700 [Ceratodon purpureus]